MQKDALEAVDQRISAFWSQVDQKGPIQPHMHTPCWVWVGKTLCRGYGQFWINGKQDYAHRISWQLTVGVIEDGLHVLHQCDNPLCVRPDHLSLGTHLDNMRDRDRKGRRSAPKGSAHGFAKLNELQVRDIKKRLAAGDRVTPLARMYGVSPSLVSRIKLGKNWSHV
jgi:hypothetical protein